MKGVIFLLEFLRMLVKLLLSLWFIFKLEFMIFVCILLSFFLRFVYFSFCFCNVSFSFVGLVLEIGVLICVGLDSCFFFVLVVFFIVVI